MREPVCRPELRQDSTAVTMIAFITSADPGMPIRSRAAMKGDSPKGTSVQGTMQTSRKIDRT
jgi:hypothetical protein